MSFLEGGGGGSGGALLDCVDQDAPLKSAWAGGDLLDATGDATDFDISSFFSQLTAAAGAAAPDAAPPAELLEDAVPAELQLALPVVGHQLAGDMCPAAAGADVALSVLLGEHAELQAALLAAPEPAQSLVAQVQPRSHFPSRSVSQCQSAAQSSVQSQSAAQSSVQSQSQSRAQSVRLLSSQSQSQPCQQSQLSASRSACGEARSKSGHPSEPRLHHSKAPIQPAANTYVVVKKQLASGRRALGRRRKQLPPYGAPPPPPITAYNHFVKTQYRKLKAGWRGLNLRRAGPMLSSIWAGMGASEREPFLQQELDDKTLYRTRLTEYRRRVRLWRHEQALARGDDPRDDEVFSDDDRNDLYCRLCNLYFSNSHNKDEHLHSRLHLRVMARADEAASAADEAAPDADEDELEEEAHDVAPAAVEDAVEAVLVNVVRREQEVRCLAELAERLKERHAGLKSQLAEMDWRREAASAAHSAAASHSRHLADQVESLLLVPTLFGVVGQWSSSVR